MSFYNPLFSNVFFFSTSAHISYSNESYLQSLEAAPHMCYFSDADKIFFAAYAILDSSILRPLCCSAAECLFTCAAAAFICNARRTVAGAVVFKIIRLFCDVNCVFVPLPPRPLRTHKGIKVKGGTLSPACFFAAAWHNVGGAVYDSRFLVQLRGIAESALIAQRWALSLRQFTILAERERF